MQKETPQTSLQEFKILFDKLEEVKGTHNELFIFHSQSESILPKSIDEIKKIVEACNQQESFITFTRS